MIYSQLKGKIMKKLVYSLALSASLLAGCATIIGDNTQTIPISSTPSDATILITDENSLEIYRGKTPASVTLNKSDGSYWGGKNFTVQIDKEGYETQLIPISSSANGWYIGGNLIFGGLVGWFIIDPLNGGMYTLSPDQISSNLDEQLTHNNMANDGSISIVLIQDVPLSLLDKMKKIN
jgi:hypothetical protein